MKDYDDNDKVVNDDDDATHDFDDDDNDDFQGAWCANGCAC